MGLNSTNQHICANIGMKVDRMSTGMVGVGLRMLSVRKRLNYTQSVMAAKLDISDRAYTNYEQEKRELPAAVAVRFCDLFSTDLKWLLTGDARSFSAAQLKILVDTVVAVLNENSLSKKEYSFENLGLFVSNAFERCEDGQNSPQDEVRKLFKMVE